MKRANNDYYNKYRTLVWYFYYIVRSFSDFIARAFCKTRSNLAAAVVITIEPKVIRKPIKTPPDKCLSIGWNGFGIADFVWTSIILLTGALIGILRMRKDKDIAYGLVLIWAYLGILLKHLSAGGFNGQYPSVIVTAIFCLVLFGIFVGRIMYKK